MPSISGDQKALYKAKIRSLLVQRPFITQRELQDALDAAGCHLDRKYLGGLLNAIYRERAKRANAWALHSALSSFQDAMEEIARVGWEIANDKHTPGRDRAAALREVREAYSAMFEKLFDAGVFERKNGVIELQIRNTPVPEDRKEAIRAVFESWGIVAPERKQIEAPKQDAERPSPPTG